MMLLSRFFYAILAACFVSSLSLVYIAIHQQNRLRERDVQLIIEHDRDAVDWFLRLDARKRLDALSIVSVDKQVRDAISRANGQDEIATEVRTPLKKRLSELAQTFASVVKDEGKAGNNPIMLFAVDHRGRVVAHVNFDRTASVKEESFEFGGFPVVADALHGWLRDDTWVWDQQIIYRVVARPVVPAEGAQASGAVIALRRIDTSFAQLVVDRTDTPVLFYVAPLRSEPQSMQIIAQAASEKSGVAFDGIRVEPSVFINDKSYLDEGVSLIKRSGNLSLSFSRMAGYSWAAGAGFAVVRKHVPVTGVQSLLANADESDKKSIPITTVLGIFGATLFIGLVAMFFEHSRPLRKLINQAQAVSKGEQNVFLLAQLSGVYRSIGQSFNEGIERMSNRSSFVHKPADLQQILGPTPAAPQMSAFSFGFNQNKTLEPSGANELFPLFGGPSSAPLTGNPSSTSTGNIPKVTFSNPDSNDDEQTAVQRIPSDLMLAAATSEGMHIVESEEELNQWRRVFDDFVALRHTLGEPTVNLSFDKFRLQLRKNKENIIKQYKCRRVKFTVYEKDHKASIKATPIRE